jgi:hypothetical protein
VGGSGGFVINAVDADLFQGFDVGFCRDEAVFFAAVTDKDEFGFLFESRQIRDVREADAAAAEHANVGERVEVRESDYAGLHAAHREASHGAMRLIGEGTEICVDVGNEIINKDMLEGGEVEVRTWAWSWFGRVVGSGGAASAASEGIPAEFHGDNERPGFSFGEEVVHDPAGVALASPAGFVFTGAMLQIEHGITIATTLVVIGRRVNECVSVGVGGFGKIPELAKLAMRHIFERVKIPVFGRDFDSAAPTSGAVEEVAVRIGDFGAVDVDRVIMKSFVERPGVAEPRTIIAFRERAAISETDANRLSFGRDDAEFNPAFGVNLRILFAPLIRGGRSPVIGGFVGLRASELECEDCDGNDEYGFGSHGIMLFCKVAVQECVEWRENNKRVRQGNDLLDKTRAEHRGSPSARAAC